MSLLPVSTPVIPGAGFPDVDAITIGPAVPPGRWVLVDATKKYGWEIRKGWGLSGATVVPIGDELVVAKFRWSFWNMNDYPAVRRIRDVYLKKALITIPGGLQALALSIGHPELKDMGVSAVVVLEVGPFINDGLGEYAANVTFLQYRPPQPALSKPLAAIPDAAAPQPTAQTAVQRENEAKVAQLASLAGAP